MTQDRRIVPKGTVIINEGDEAHEAFLIQSGKAAVYITDPTGKKIHISTVGPGEIIGEMSLVSDEPRTARVEALESCTLIGITRTVFRQKLERSDPTIRALVAMLMARVMEGNKSRVSPRHDMEDLIHHIHAFYKDLEKPLPPAQKKTLENKLKLQLDEFVEALRTYRDKFMP